ncbi:MAG: hypothetical protein AAGF11_54420 [Myxococcota bacterium]
MFAASASSNRAAALPLASLYRFIARITVTELDPPALGVLRQPAIRDILTRCDPQVPQVLDAPTTTAWRRDADEAFTAAFLLPTGAPPRAAAWRADGSDPSLDHLTSGVAHQMRRLGLERRIDGHAGRLPLDHLALMLEVAAVQLEREPAEASAWLGTYVHGWAARWGRALAERSTYPIYRAFGVLCASLFERPAA